MVKTGNTEVFWMVGTQHLPLTTVSLFTGAGGLDLGLEAVGFRTLFASDIDHHSCRTLEDGRERSRELALPFLDHAIVREADISELDPQEILDAIGLAPGELDLLAGGPPCQAFSVFGRRKGRLDPRGMLVYDYLRMLADLKPRAFVFENVYGILTVEGGAVFEDVLEKLRDPAVGLHYTLSVLRVNAADFGVPQFRDRVFIVGSRDGLTVTEPKPLATQSGAAGAMPWRTVRDALRNMPLVGDLPNHTGRNHSQRIVDRYETLRPGERDPKTRINKLDLGRPSFTIIVGSDHGGGKGHVHPLEPREVTPRESARIQTFPDWWAFSGKGRHAIRQVGNAVPPLLAAAIGNGIRSDIFKMEPVPMGQYASLLGQDHLFDGGNECHLLTGLHGQGLTADVKASGEPRSSLAS